MSRLTQVAASQTDQFNIRGYHPLCRAFPDASDADLFSPTVPVVTHPPWQPLQPRADATVRPLHIRGLGSSPFARRY